MNTVEAMCVALVRDADGDAEIANAQAAFRKKLDEWIPLILTAQEPDGYFQTRITLGYPREKDQPAVARRGFPVRHQAAEIRRLKRHRHYLCRAAT